MIHAHRNHNYHTVFTHTGAHFMQYQCTQLMTDYALSEHRQTHIASIENLLHMHIAVITRV